MSTILERLIQKIQGAKIDTQPSDNFYMEDIFSPEVYKEILMRLPEDHDYDFIDHPDAILPDGRKTRKLLDLTEKNIQRLHPDNQNFWREIHKVVTSKELLDAIVTKFRQKIVAQLGENLPEMVIVPIFYRDYPGYRIGVHTDAPFKVATMQFYFPKDESQIHLGTSFHQKIDNQFPILKTNQFKPNSGYAFARTDSSWHSVQQMAAYESIRNTLALTIYKKGYEYKSDKGYM